MPSSPRPSSAYGRAGGEVTLRLRCPAGGDVCFDIAPTACVGAVRARAVEAWPTAGPLAADAPSTAADVRLIANGRFLADGETVEALRAALGRPPPGHPLTLHCVVRRAPPPKGKGDGGGGGGKAASLTASAGGEAGADGGRGCCGCVVQ